MFMCFCFCMIFGSFFFFFFFFFNDTATTEIYTLSLHDALPIEDAGSWLSDREAQEVLPSMPRSRSCGRPTRSEEHTSELQSPCNLVCRLLLEKKKKNKKLIFYIKKKKKKKNKLSTNTIK